MLHFVDSTGARIVAAAVSVAMLALLGYIHRDDLWPPEPAAPATAASPYQDCLTERLGAVEQMAAEGVATAAQIDLFKARAEALCRAQNRE